MRLRAVRAVPGLIQAGMSALDLKGFYRPYRLTVAAGEQREPAMKRLTRRSSIVALALLASVALARIARAEPGVTDTEIKIGMWAPLSGPVALLGQSARDAVRIWAKEVNDKGGIN